MVIRRGRPVVVDVGVHRGERQVTHVGPWFIVIVVVQVNSATNALRVRRGIWGNRIDELVNSLTATRLLIHLDAAF